MIDNYGLFNKHEENDTLLILFFDVKPDNYKQFNEVKVLYKDNAIVGYEISNFIKYAKIKYSGIVFMPANALIDVINLILNKYNLENINYKKESGYVIKRHNGKTLVFAKEGTFLRDETISKGQYCTYYDLYIKSENEDQLIELNENNLEDKDFFGVEVY